MPLEIDTAGGAKAIDLAGYLDASLEERAHEESYAWIKGLRHARVDGVPFRSRWTFRGDSLWWFAELFLHKQQVVLDLHRRILAFESIVARERPTAIRCRDRHERWLVERLCARHGVRFEGASGLAPAWPPLMLMDARAALLHGSAVWSPARRRNAPRTHAGVAAFVHRAFWRGRTVDGGAESYIGPVLQQIEERAGRDHVRYIAIGPRSKFRARRWWDSLRPGELPPAVAPVESYAPRRALRESADYWRRRHAVRRAMAASDDIRARAVIRGCDCWPAIEPEIAGIALLQFPWSTRVMDEAAAALDALTPDIAVTYAEAGGWGRAIALECRRRGIPFVGLQHGFIYRHWLNYRHEPDEMLPDPANAADAGFPRPTLTLVYDDQTAAQLVTRGRFPPASIRVTGSPRLDDLVAAVRGMTPAARAKTKQDAGAGDADALVLVATKEREATSVLPDFIAAAGAMTGVRIVIKPHPAETAAVYAAAARGATNVTVLDPAAPLAPLLAVASVLVTVNSTVAIDALALGVPSLVIGLPNNLTPFVEQGRMAGASTREEMRAVLERLLYDQVFRRTLLHASEEAARGPSTEGSSAARTASAVLAAAKE